ncbi:MAG TPA: hypothetical protein DCR24_12885 [Bacillus bacterium]|nr:hypothetical protein [Bacillus sp. (in: firmicutes)]
MKDQKNDITAMIGKLSFLNKDKGDFARLDYKLGQLIKRKEELLRVKLESQLILKHLQSRVS